MHDSDYEIIINEWTTDYIEKNYKKVRAFAGGNKGRDIVGYYGDGTIDIYQGKHYKNKVTPTTLYVELGKLCHYTYIKEYPVPKNYLIVAPKGCGLDVLDLIDNPQSVNQKLIDKAKTLSDQFGDTVCPLCSAPLTNNHFAHILEKEIFAIAAIEELEKYTSKLVGLQATLAELRLKTNSST